MSGVTIAAVADSDSSSLDLASRSLPAAAKFRDTAAMLAGTPLDALLIALPPHLHAEAALAAFRAGLHVYIEKPLASSVSDGDLVIDSWRKAGTAGMIGFNYRFNPLYGELRRRIAAGDIGSVVAIQSVFSLATHRLAPWKLARETGGGVLLDLASHHVDMTRFLTGREITSVSAEVQSVRAEGDTAALTMRLDDGVLVQSFVSLGSVDEDAINVYGDAGKLSVDRLVSLRPVFMPARAARAQRLVKISQRIAATAQGIPHLALKMKSPASEPSYRRALEHFVNCARNGDTPSPSLDDGLTALKVVEAAETSAALGSTVPVPTHASSAQHLSVENHAINSTR